MLALEDFEAFTEAEFAPVPFAASLLAATNADDSELDLATAIKRLQFDHTECDRRTRTLAEAHAPALAANFARASGARQLITGALEPRTAHAQRQYQRIEEEVVAPYENATALHAALGRIHATLTVLRQAGFFLVFVQQLHACEDALSGAEPDVRELVRQARLQNQLAKMLERDAPLAGLRMVREYGPLLAARREKFVAQLATQVQGEMAHHTAFHARNDRLLAGVYALFEADRQECAAVLERGLSKLVQVALASLTRSLQSPRTFRTAVADASAAADTFVSTLREVLRGACVYADDAEKEEKDDVLTRADEQGQAGEDNGAAEGRADYGEVYAAFEHSLGDLVDRVYWLRMAYKFKKNLAATMARGGPVARNLRASRGTMEAAVVGPSWARASLLDALALVDQEHP